jgi:4'-phosphopantetheinyl transferase
MINDWSNFPGQACLPEGESQTWIAWLDKEEPHAYWGFLSEDECLRARRFRDARSADRFTIARGILRSLLAGYLSSSPGQLVFSYGTNGKPELTGDLQGKMKFNVSHSGNLAIFAFANGLDVGVDIEEIHAISDLEGTAAMILSADELIEFKALPPDRKLERFFTIWTCKEAILKAFGSGFKGPVQGVLTSFCQSQPILDGRNDISENKQLTLFTPAEGFKGALACLNPISKENNYDQ